MKRWWTITFAAARWSKCLHRFIDLFFSFCTELSDSGSEFGTTTKNKIGTTETELGGHVFCRVFFCFFLGNKWGGGTKWGQGKPRQGGLYIMLIVCFSLVSRLVYPFVDHHNHNHHHHHHHHHHRNGTWITMVFFVSVPPAKAGCRCRKSEPPLPFPCFRSFLFFLSFFLSFSLSFSLISQKREVTVVGRRGGGGEEQDLEEQ